jgi:hypothetical protein
LIGFLGLLLALKTSSSWWLELISVTLYCYIDK